MMLAYIAPFLALSAIVLCFGSIYYMIVNAIRSRTPKQIRTTNLNYINFKKIFPY